MASIGSRAIRANRRAQGIANSNAESGNGPQTSSSDGEDLPQDAEKEIGEDSMTTNEPEEDPEMLDEDDQRVREDDIEGRQEMQEGNRNDDDIQLSEDENSDEERLEEESNSTSDKDTINQDKAGDKTSEEDESSSNSDTDSSDSSEADQSSSSDSDTDDLSLISSGSDSFSESSSSEDESDSSSEDNRRSKKKKKRANKKAAKMKKSKSKSKKTSKGKTKAKKSKDKKIEEKKQRQQVFEKEVRDKDRDRIYPNRRLSSPSTFLERTNDGTSNKSNKGLDAPSEYNLTFGEWSECMSLFRRYLAGYYDIGILMTKYENQAKDKSLRAGEANGGDTNPYAKGGRLENRHPETGAYRSNPSSHLTNVDRFTRQQNDSNPLKRKRGKRGGHATAQHQSQTTVPKPVPRPIHHNLPANPMIYQQLNPLPQTTNVTSNRFPNRGGRGSWRGGRGSFHNNRNEG
ncbi:uncharacterized protein MELLADRAFT_111475 [Melampsora larici-populina 98AG31]|uniref:Uncharacterized protein n=1 Tax=Melampsora larici-populina (strain 98AG31 / pathotype 3-4-7) TaxID=747676 RepID=F4S3A8_MELLP|nr:uncharacterized protein MELLADRAFT_111475 [Melampsora larici-populina 98AG31]EGG00874.1 hypothetical protein MELLADRAFT_111475 [Melampsora larici-populina 98AG31]